MTRERSSRDAAERRPLWQQGIRPAAGVAAALWLPLIFAEITSPYSVSHLIDSELMRRSLALVAAVSFAVVTVTAALSGLCAHLMQRWPRVADPAGPRAAAVAMVSLACTLVMARAGLRSELLLTIGLSPWLAGCALLAVATVMLLCLVSRPRARRMVCALFAVVALLGWGAFHIANSDGAGLRTLSAGLGIMAALGVVVAGGLPRRPGRWTPLAWVTLVLIVPSVVAAGSPLVRVDRAPADAREVAASERPNVVVFLIDTLRADHTGLGGYARPTTPVLDALAAQRATWFARAHAPATSTLPSTKGLFTGRSPSSWGLSEAANEPPPRSAWTLAQAFRKVGYRTGAFTSNTLVRGGGFGNGFDMFWALGGLASYHDSLVLHRLLSMGDYWDAMRNVALFNLHKVHGRTVVSKALEWLQAQRGNPTFTYVHIVEPHWPFYERGHGLAVDAHDITPLSHVDLLRLPRRHPGASTLVDRPELKEMRGRYDEEVFEGDRVLGIFLSELKRLGLDDSTLLVALSDHGEEFFEHLSFSHGFDVFEEQSHVPMVVRWPRHERFSSMPTSVQQPVSLLDLMPTLTDLLGLPAARADLDGRSLVNLLNAAGQEGAQPGTARAPAPIITESFEPRVCRAAYREGQLKVRMRFTPEASPLLSNAVTVYDLATDPRELHPRAASDPRYVALVERARRALHERWMRWPEREPVQQPVSAASHDQDDETVEMNDTALEQLRALGYAE